MAELTYRVGEYYTQPDRGAAAQMGLGMYGVCGYAICKIIILNYMPP